jgi:hypothetical protein
MKSIGFVDYYISEWHANNYPVWIKEVCEKSGAQFEVKYAWAETEISPVDGKSTDTWCEEFGVQKCESIAELCEKSDYIVILAPSNPEKHLEYAKEALKYGKNTYIDKTFSPDYATAKEIFDLAAEYGTRFFSTSALRFASELKDFENANNLLIKGGGSNLEEYIIHTVEIAVALLKENVSAVKIRIEGERRIGELITPSGRKATLDFAPQNGFVVSGTLPDGSHLEKTISSNFFGALMEEILKFFENGEIPFDESQTIEAMALRDAFICFKEV